MDGIFGNPNDLGDSPAKTLTCLEIPGLPIDPISSSDRGEGSPDLQLVFGEKVSTPGVPSFRSPNFPGVLG